MNEVEFREKITVAERLIAEYIRKSPPFDGDGKLASQIGTAIGEIKGDLQIPLDLNH